MCRADATVWRANFQTFRNDQNHNKRSRHILGVHGNIITAVKLNVRHRSASQNLLIYFYSVNDVGYKYQ